MFGEALAMVTVADTWSGISDRWFWNFTFTPPSGKYVKLDRESRRRGPPITGMLPGESMTMNGTFSNRWSPLRDPTKSKSSFKTPTHGIRSPV